MLYELDARPFQIELDAAEAALRKATAVLNQESKNDKRKEMLAPSGAAAQSQLEIAIANVGQAEADVAAREADVARAKLNLEYTRHSRADQRPNRPRARHRRRAGRSIRTDACGHDPAARSDLRRLHPIGRRAERAAARIRDRRACNKARPRGCGLSSTTVEVYPHDGKLLFSDSTVDPGTGQVTLRGEFPNPNLSLLPGMYVRVQIDAGHRSRCARGAAAGRPPQRRRRQRSVRGARRQPRQA